MGTQRISADPNKQRSHSKLDPDTSTTIVQAVRAGNYIDVAAQYAGITRETLYAWLKKGREATYGPYFEFERDLTEAVAQAEVRDLALIGKAAEEQWQAAAWRLERRYPDRYGKKTRVDGTVTVQAKPMVDYSKLSAEELQTLRHLLAKAAPDAEDPALGTDGRPALELLPAAEIDDDDDVLEGEVV